MYSLAEHGVFVQSYPTLRDTQREIHVYNTREQPNIKLCDITTVLFEVSALINSILPSSHFALFEMSLCMNN